MKKLNFYVSAVLMCLSFSAHSFAKIDSIVLNDNTIISAKEIAAINSHSFTNELDFVELEIGSRIESSEIKEIIFKDQKQNGAKDFEVNFKVGGDGSGG